MFHPGILIRDGLSELGEASGNDLYRWYKKRLHELDLIRKPMSYLSFMRYCYLLQQKGLVRKTRSEAMRQPPTVPNPLIGISPGIRPPGNEQLGRGVFEARRVIMQLTEAGRASDDLFRDPWAGVIRRARERINIMPTQPITGVTPQVPQLPRAIPRLPIAPPLIMPPPMAPSIQRPRVPLHELEPLRSSLLDRALAAAREASPAFFLQLAKDTIEFSRAAKAANLQNRPGFKQVADDINDARDALVQCIKRLADPGSLSQRTILDNCRLAAVEILAPALTQMAKATGAS